MLNTRLDTLPGYPFARLRRLLEPVAPPAGVAPMLMSIGEPQHRPPAIVAEVLAARAADWGKYPLLRGTPEFRRAVADWLSKRFRLPSGFIEAERNLLPVSGTREAIFMFAQVAVSRAQARDDSAPIVLVPNPLYHVYAGAAIMAGGEPLYLPATRDSGFLPDYSQVPDDIWPRVALVYLCAPANPQGVHAPLSFLKDLIARAVAYDFIVAVDECYSEIYDAAKPSGALEACAALGATDAGEAARALDHVVVFNSLSKRSNCAGLRSGFVAGGARLIEAFAKLRDYASCATPLPVIHAATELWRDESHVTANRARYRAKFDIADRILGNRFGYYRPPGGFFLWLDVRDAARAGGGSADPGAGRAGVPSGETPGEAACRQLWRTAAIRVLPGAYLCPESAPGPGAGYIRVALVQDNDAILAQGLGRLAEVLG